MFRPFHLDEVAVSDWIEPKKKQGGLLGTVEPMDPPVAMTWTNSVYLLDQGTRARDFR